MGCQECDFGPDWLWLQPRLQGNEGLKAKAKAKAKAQQTRLAYSPLLRALRRRSILKM